MRRFRHWFFKAGDFAWLLFVAILMANAPETNYDAFILLPLIGAFQIVEPRLKIFRSRGGQVVSLALKLVLSYLLVGWTHALESYYYQIFLIPVVSAATTFELVGSDYSDGDCRARVFLFLAADFRIRPVAIAARPGQLDVFTRGIFCDCGFLVYEQARAKRLQMARTEEAAAQLAESNKSLREAQVSLRRSERLAALGQLTAGLAHELRNPLGTIKASAEMLTKETLESQAGSARGDGGVYRQ